MLLLKLIYWIVFSATVLGMLAGLAFVVQVVNEIWGRGDVVVVAVVCLSLQRLWVFLYPKTPGD